MKIKIIKRKALNADFSDIKSNIIDIETSAVADSTTIQDPAITVSEFGNKTSFNKHSPKVHTLQTKNPIAPI